MMAASSIYRRVWWHPAVFTGKYVGSQYYLQGSMVASSSIYKRLRWHCSHLPDTSPLGDLISHGQKPHKRPPRKTVWSPGSWALWHAGRRLGLDCCQDYPIFMAGVCLIYFMSEYCNFTFKSLKKHNICVCKWLLIEEIHHTGPSFTILMIICSQLDNPTKYY